MRRILSKQRDVRFFFCPSPVTIDKRAEWGNSADNHQQAPNGAFLKTSSDTEISMDFMSSTDFRQSAV